jgi:hypothetical protein
VSDFVSFVEIQRLGNNHEWFLWTLRSRHRHFLCGVVVVNDKQKKKKTPRKMERITSREVLNRSVSAI